MFYVVIGLIAIVLVSIALTLYALLNKREMVAHIAALQNSLQEQEANSIAEIDRLTAELAKLDKFKHIPKVIEKSKKLEAEIAGKLQQAQKEADEIVLIAHKDVARMNGRLAARTDEVNKQ